MARTPGSVADETRRRIIEAAARLFAERGYAGTSIRDLALELGMTKAALYYHFASKEDLLFAVADPVLGVMDAYVTEALAADRIGPAAVAVAVERLVDVFDRHAPLVRRLIGDPSVTRAMKARHPLPGMHALKDCPGGIDRVAEMRAWCAVAVIQAGVLGPMHDMPEPPPGGSRPERAPLSPVERSFLIRAALTVLAVPETAPRPAPEPAPGPAPGPAPAMAPEPTLDPASGPVVAENRDAPVRGRGRSGRILR